MLSRRIGPDRSVPAALALGALCGCAVLTAVDPADGAPYPACPTRILLGIDCPACGTLRGLHALSRGQVASALDHNLLLLVAVPLGALVWVRWAAAAWGRPVGPLTVPRPVIVALITIAVAFAVTRNLPVDGLRWLDSA